MRYICCSQSYDTSIKIFTDALFKQFDSTSLQEMHLKLEEQIKRGLESKTFSDIEKARIQGQVIMGHVCGLSMNPRKGERTYKSRRKNKIRTKIDTRKK